MTVNVGWVVWVRPPPVPVMTSEYVPGVAMVVVIRRVLVMAEVMGFRLQEAEAAVGRLPTVRVTERVKPYKAVIPKVYVVLELLPM
jgi:hypothetical protein